MNREGTDFPAGFPQPQRRTRQPRRSSGRALGVLATAVLIAVATVIFLLGTSWLRSQRAVHVVEAQIEAIRGGQVEEAYELFSRRYRRATSLPMFRRWLRRQEGLANLQHLQFWGRSVWGQTALLWGRFEDELGHRYPVRYLLVREGGTWRIERFQLATERPDPPPRSERLIGI